MSYKIVKRGGDRPYRIINKQTRRVVGTSKLLSKAKRSIGYREAAVAEKERLTKK